MYKKCVARAKLLFCLWNLIIIILYFALGLLWLSFLNHYALSFLFRFWQVFFKIQDFTMSGCAIDPRSLVVYPSGKCKLTISKFSSIVQNKKYTRPVFLWTKAAAQGSSFKMRSTPVTRTLHNSSLPLARSNFHFPSDRFLYNFTLDNSNPR